MKDINYPDYPENWEGGGGEGDKSYSPEGYYVNWFSCNSKPLTGTIDSPMGQNKHIILIQKQGSLGYNEYVKKFKGEKDTTYHYLKAKQKAWNKLMQVLRKINKGELLNEG